MSAIGAALPASQRERYEAAVNEAGRLLAAAIRDLCESPGAAMPGGPSERDIAAASGRLRKQAAGNPAA